MPKLLQYAAPGAKRSYRQRMKPEGLVRFDVRVEETDLTVFAEKDLSREALSRIVRIRSGLAGYAEKHDGFFESLEPLAAGRGAPEVVRRMCEAATRWGVGPMAAVAGTVAEMVGEALLASSREVIVENGGDIFIATQRPREIAIFAGDDSPFEGLAVKVRPESGIRGVCTSSGTVGHSFSRGRADAVAAFAATAAEADAAATAIGNLVRSADDVDGVVEAERVRGALAGLVVVIADKMGAFGEIEFV